jgi:hypothetical protein
MVTGTVLKIAAFAPTPSVRTITPVIVKSGVRTNDRQAQRRSCLKVPSMRHHVAAATFQQRQAARPHQDGRF